MKQQYIPLFKKQSDFYTALRIPAEAITITEGFSLCDLGMLTSVTSPVYRAGFHSFLFVKEATGQFLLNQHTCDIAPGSVCISNPGDLTQLHFSDVREAYLLTMTDSFLKEHTYPDVMQEFPFLQSEGLPPIVPGHEQFMAFERLYDQIRLANHSQSVLRKKEISYLILLVLLKIKEAVPHLPPAVVNLGAKTYAVRKFKRMLQHHYQDLQNGYANKVFNVKEYADALGMHPNYLNHIIKETTGTPVSKWIIDKTISESKMLLAYSSLSIKEIAYRMGFAEASYFSRYFKKYTQLTAAEYRRTTESGPVSQPARQMINA